MSAGLSFTMDMKVIRSRNVSDVQRFPAVSRYGFTRVVTCSIHTFPGRTWHLKSVIDPLVVCVNAQSQVSLYRLVHLSVAWCIADGPKHETESEHSCALACGTKQVLNNLCHRPCWLCSYTLGFNTMPLALFVLRSP